MGFHALPTFEVSHDTSSNVCGHDGIFYYLYDLNGRWTAALNSGGGQCDYELVYAGNRHIATYAGGTVFPHADWLGTERLRINYTYVANRNNDEKCTSLPFGDALNCGGGGDPSPLHFTGKERDPESNLDNFLARYYTSSPGRFMSPDWSTVPIGVPYANFGNPQSLNLYGYVGNNPTSRRDANGHHQECDPDTFSIDPRSGAAKLVGGKCHEVPDWWQFQGIRNWFRPGPPPNANTTVANMHRFGDWASALGAVGSGAYAAAHARPRVKAKLSGRVGVVQMDTEGDTSLGLPAAQVNINVSIGGPTSDQKTLGDVSVNGEYFGAGTSVVQGSQGDVQFQGTTGSVGVGFPPYPIDVTVPYDEVFPPGENLPMTIPWNDAQPFM